VDGDRISAPPTSAFGASAGIGGTIQVPIHLDVVVKERRRNRREAILGGGEL